jgi:FKBP-type peptidyl-prolyl cis-trans isomerase
MDDQTNQNNTSGSQPAAKLEGTKMPGFDPVESVPELQIIDVREGNGLAVPQGATITAHYTGALCSDGTIFQSSHDFGDAITFPLDGVIAGWQLGVPGMKVGGIRRLVIPAVQAYGPQSPSPNIPPNSDLVFDIELVAIN